MRFNLILIALIILASCDNSTPDSEAPADSTIILEQGKELPAKDSVPPPADASGCYLKVLARDTMVVHLEQQGAELTGRMTFDNFEKDGSTGVVHGKVEGNTAKIWYDFEAEGTRSVMEVWFRIADKQLIRGIGSFGVKGDTSYYTNKPDIQYGEEQVFPKVDCRKVPAKYLAN